MSFDTLCKIIKRPTEKYILQEKITFTEDVEAKIVKDAVGNIITKNAVGNIVERWEDVKILEGVIQHRQDEKISEAGEESEILYTGYFRSLFHLDTNKLANYRVKFIRDYEILYLKIIEYDSNNYLRSNHHHIVLKMKEDKKYKGRQQ